MLMLNVPATIGLLVLAEPIVALLYQRGQFTSADTAATAAALMFYAPGLVGYSAVKIASPTFYALRDSRTPVIVSLMSVGLNLGLNLLLLDIMGFKGLALGTALASLFNALALLWVLRRRLDGLEERRIATGLVKIVVASAAMAIVAVATSRWLETALAGDGELQKMLRVLLSIGAAVGALGLTARVLGIDEFTDAMRRLMRRLAAGGR
jgi:putative peptidoglycan lipid II flippase